MDPIVFDWAWSFGKGLEVAGHLLAFETRNDFEYVRRVLSRALSARLLVAVLVAGLSEIQILCIE